jgi:uncharacterized membrane protein YphA (DoxX/SURF4 family)
MEKSVEATHHSTRATVSLIAGILIGATFLLSGTGKAFGYGDMPGQTMQFIDAVIPYAWLTPRLALFIDYVFLPYIIPWTELCLGILLLVRIWPRFFAIITLPLTAAFMANNAWYISQGRIAFTPCECFGIWERFLGTLTHVQSLYIDIALFALALTIVIVHPGGFFSSPPWLAKKGQGAKGKDKTRNPHYVKNN